MRVSSYKCDFCEKEIRDKHNEPGWITLHGSTAGGFDIGITIFLSRRKNKLVRSVLHNDVNLDFCSTDCLIAYLKKEK